MIWTVYEQKGYPFALSNATDPPSNPDLALVGAENSNIRKGKKQKKGQTHLSKLFELGSPIILTTE
jgi:hypothetical protein